MSVEPKGFVSVDDVALMQANRAHTAREGEYEEVEWKVDFLVQKHMSNARSYSLPTQNRMQEEMRGVRNTALKELNVLKGQCLNHGALAKKGEEFYQKIDKVAADILLSDQRFQQDQKKLSKELLDSILSESRALRTAPFESEQERRMDRLKREKSYDKPSVMEGISNSLRCIVKGKEPPKV